MTYRPTVRYDDSFRTYVDGLFQTTHLDRNQIHRLALFLLGFTPEGRKVLGRYLKANHELPEPPWESINDSSIWLERVWNKNKLDVKVKENKKIEMKETGGIIFNFSDLPPIR